MKVIVIGAGLAGSEAAYQLAKRGVEVELYEMRPIKFTPAHKTDRFAELVCSNSLKSKDIYNAHGLLKAELKRLDSLIMKAAEYAELPGGKALVVDREKFSDFITETLKKFPNVKVIHEEITKIPEDEIVIVATGPLTSEALAENLRNLLGLEYLSFFDALSPIVDAESLDYSKLYFKDRHGWDDSSYLNAPMNEEEYYRFYEALINAEVFMGHDFEEKEKARYFEGCLPIEEMARRGPETLRYGPLRASGLPDPKTGKEPFAVVQLRPENLERTAYSLVGFQTQLKIPEQRRVFRMIPGLENARFLRYGAVHRNTFIKAPAVMEPTLQVRKKPNIFIAGQIVGTEGYVEAAMGGLVAGINAYLLATGREPLVFPVHTMIGALLDYIAHSDPKHFQPMNANIGLFKDIPPHVRKKHRREFIVRRARETLEEWIKRSKIF